VNKLVCYFLKSLERRLIRNSTIKIKKRILAISSAPEAIPPNPKMAAIIAITIKIIVQRSIISSID